MASKSLVIHISCIVLYISCFVLWCQWWPLAWILRGNSFAVIPDRNNDVVCQSLQVTTQFPPRESLEARRGECNNILQGFARIEPPCLEYTHISPLYMSESCSGSDSSHTNPGIIFQKLKALLPLPCIWDDWLCRERPQLTLHVLGYAWVVHGTITTEKDLLHIYFDQGDADNPFSKVAAAQLALRERLD